jgi:hypothetical protein
MGNDDGAARVVLPMMSERTKGAVVAVVTMLAIGVTWTAFADPEQRCPGGDYFDPSCVPSWPPHVLFAGTVLPGLPCAVVIGWLVGGLGGLLERWRVPVIAAIAAGVAVIPAAAAAGTWPSHGLHMFGRLAPVAICFSVIAALMLERWTRRPPAVPVAIAR